MKEKTSLAVDHLIVDVNKMHYMPDITRRIASIF